MSLYLCIIGGIDTLSMWSNNGGTDLYTYDVILDEIKPLPLCTCKTPCVVNVFFFFLM